MIFTHWLQFFFVGKPWYVAAIWGNIFCVIVAAPLAWLWSKTKFWPLRPLNAAVHGLHEKFDAHHTQVVAEHTRRQEHDRWTHDALLAVHRGEAPPAHPHYDA
jgi:hypothetical protein